jgi:hypothetical protein
MNGIQKETLKQMSLEDMVKGIIDMIYDMRKDSEEYWAKQPPKCAKQFVKVKHVKIAGAIIIAYLVGSGVISFTTALRIFPFL